MNLTQPLALLISELSKRKQYRQVYIQKGGVTLRLEQPVSGAAVK